MLLSMDPFQFLLFGKREKCRKQFCAFTAITAAAKSSASLARSWFLWLQEIVLAFFFELQHNPIYRRTLKTLLHHDCVLWHVSLTSHYLTLQDLLSELSKKANLDVLSAGRGWGESHCWKSFKRCTNCPGRRSINLWPLSNGSKSFLFTKVSSALTKIRLSNMCNDFCKMTVCLVIEQKAYRIGSHQVTSRCCDGL